ncbi:MAG TPA: hypothetical protein VLL56_05200, partial [Terriglobia bacterium]|nr:hypothetical protein [Terriglobia bacterium]
MQRSKLHLNPKFSKLGTQLFRVLMVNGVHPKAPRAFKVERPVVNENAFLRRTLGNFQSDAKDRLLRLARANVTRAEENEEISSKVEGLNAVLVELQWLIVDGAHKI